MIMDINERIGFAITKKRVVVEFVLPIYGEDITISNLRILGKMLNKQEGCTVEPFVFCNESQRARVSMLAQFVPANRFGFVIPERRDFGACEQFRFLWLPADRAEGR
jgi:hypothetical protein